MSPPETFDAFYARTAWSVTSQMHSMTGQDSAADHAVREAYARAYQQWYEVSGYHDPRPGCSRSPRRPTSAAALRPLRPD